MEVTVGHGLKMHEQIDLQKTRVSAQQQHGPRPPLVYSCSVLAHVPARRFSSNLFFVSLVFLTSCTHSTLSTPSALIEAYSSKNHNPVISSSIHLDRSLDSH
ncbi:hypothetical protein I312_105864 [Cryptococcus bacillisporus CA1280]|uniref:uncharacterized protein n=1 Tax=Cryptococcus bacillisporus CA1280 TaxID=1296109 RepID=UPI00336702EA